MEIVDLSLHLYEGMPRFPGKWHTDVRIENTGSYEKNQCLVHKIKLCTHSGTHIDAPKHFFKKGLSIDRIDLKCFITQAHLLDLTFVKPGQSVKEDNLRTFNLEKAEAVILNTGWYKQWFTGNYYSNFPEFTGEAALYLKEFQNIRAIATDIPFNIEVHKILLGAGKILIENIINLDQIKWENPVELIALPLKIKDGDAAPARVIAVKK